MSATTSYSPEEVTSRVVHIENYLQSKLEDADLDYIYVKSRYIAQNLDFSSKQVGSVWDNINDRDNGLVADKWGESTSTTWIVKNSVTQ